MNEIFEIAVVGIEVAAVLILLAGLVFSASRFLGRVVRGPERLSAYQVLRRDVGRTLIMSLELLIAADIIDTVAIDQTFTSLGILGLLVLIRTFLSFALELDESGRWPWQNRVEAKAEE